MKFQIGGQGWPIGAWLAPSGTIFDYDKPDMWTASVPRGLIPPNAVCLDAEAWNAALAAYPNDEHLLGHPDPTWRANVTAALKRMNAADWRGKFAAWFQLMMSCKWVGVSLADFTAWSGSDPQETARCWRAVEPKSAHAFWKALDQRKIKVELE